MFRNASQQSGEVAGWHAGFGIVCSYLGDVSVLSAMFDSVTPLVPLSRQGNLGNPAVLLQCGTVFVLRNAVKVGVFPGVR